MLDLDRYRKDCAQLSLGAEKLEEMIAMTENQKQKRLARPARAALVAAALAAALCLTAAAAEVPAVREFFASIVTVTVTGTEDGVFAGLAIPPVTVEEREGRMFLVVDGEETDVTDALETDGKYLYEGEGFRVEVDEKGIATITATSSDGETVMSYTSEPLQEGQAPVYTVTDDAGSREMDWVKADEAEASKDQEVTMRIVSEDGEVHTYPIPDGE